MKKSAHSSGDYLASASDLMASLVFVFVIVAVLFAVRAKGAEKDASAAKKDAIAAKGQADEERKHLIDANDAVAGAAAARKDLLDKLAKALKDHSINVDVTDDGIRFQSEVLFDLGASDLKPAGKLALRELGQRLKDLLPCFVPAETNGSVRCEKGRSYPRGVDALLVEGHTDGVRSTRRNGNWGLSAERALAAFRELEEPLGPFKNLKGQRLLGIAGYGSSRSIQTTIPDASAAEDRPSDRRIEIRILMAAPTVQGVDSGVP